MFLQLGEPFDFICFFLLGKDLIKTDLKPFYRPLIIIFCYFALFKYIL